MLTDMLIFVTWFFYGASALGLFVLRYKMPNTYRPYRVIVYPFVPLIFIAFTFCFLCITLIDDIHKYVNGQIAIMNSVLGVAITLVGLFFYKKS
jgi:APA family basic amino acid/polyamine antiporter